MSILNISICWFSPFPHKDLWVLLEIFCMWTVIIVLIYPAFQQGSPRWKTCTLGPRALFAASRRDLALRTWSLEPSAWYSRDYQPSWFRLQKANCPVADFVYENTPGISLWFWSGRRLSCPRFSDWSISVSLGSQCVPWFASSWLLLLPWASKNGRAAFQPQPPSQQVDYHCL